MRKIGVLIVLMVVLLNCRNSAVKNNVEEHKSIDSNSEIDSIAIVQINKLIIELLKWSDSDNNFYTLPVKPDQNDSLYIFDHTELESNIQILKETGFFAAEFINNYKRIILELVRKLTAKEFEYKNWFVGDLPIFCFANNINPWWSEQGSFPIDLVKVKHEEKDHLIWIHGDPSGYWKNFKYSFKVVKEEGSWKISYLEGFDYEAGIRDDGNCI